MLKQQKKITIPKTMTDTQRLRAEYKERDIIFKLAYTKCRKSFRSTTDMNIRKMIKNSAKGYSFFKASHFNDDLTNSEYRIALRKVNSCVNKVERLTLINRLKASAITYFKQEDVFPLTMVQFLVDHDLKVMGY